MAQTIHSTDLRRRLRQVLEQVRLHREPVIVHSYDRPQAVLIPYEGLAEYQEWLAQRRQRATLLGELRRIAEEASARAALGEHDVEAVIAEAIRETRQARANDGDKAGEAQRR